MPYKSTDFRSNPSAPMGHWVCTRTSSLQPFDAPPPEVNRHGPDFCGQCVSFVTTVCPELPVNTNHWSKGSWVKGNAAIEEGTVIATFNENGVYVGHAAIYMYQTDEGVRVMDQWVSGIPRGVDERTIRWDGGPSVSNNGSSFYVVE